MPLLMPLRNAQPCLIGGRVGCATRHVRRTGMRCRRPSCRTPPPQSKRICVDRLGAGQPPLPYRSPIAANHGMKAACLRPWPCAAIRDASSYQNPGLQSPCVGRTAKICLRRACASLATTEGSAYGLPQRGKSQAMTLCCGSPLQRNSCFSIALAAKSVACCSVWRLSCGSDIHSRMIVRRTACSGFMSQSLLKPLWGRQYLDQERRITV